MKKIVFGLLFLLIMGCSETQPTLESPCKGVTCSGHGSCVAVDETPTCSCESGYLVNGLSCYLDCTSIPNSVPNIYNDACLCPENYKTVLSNNELIACTYGEDCKDGYIFRNGKCELECEDQFAHANESNNECICDDGYIPIGGNCIIDCHHIPFSNPATDNLSCQCDAGYKKVGDNCILDCNDANNVEPDSSNTECVCKDGYFETNTSGVCVDPCKDVECMNNEECNPLDFQSYLCECIPNRTLSSSYELALTNSEFEKGNLKMAFSGTLYGVVWQQLDDSGLWNIYMTLVDQNRNVVKAPFIINQNANSGHKTNPDITTDGNNFFVVWEDRRNDALDGDNMNYDVYFARVSPAGSVLSETMVTTETGAGVYGDSIRPRAYWNSETSSYNVFWIERKISTEESALYVRKYNANGESAIQPTAITIENNQRNFNLTIDDDGNYGMVWEERHPRIGFNAIYFEKIDSIGTVLVTPKLLSFMPADYLSPSIAWDGDNFGIFYTMWGSDGYFTLMNKEGDKLFEDKYIESIFYGDGQNNERLLWNGVQYTLFIYSGEFYIKNFHPLQENLMAGGISRITNLASTIAKEYSFGDIVVHPSGYYSFAWIDRKYGSSNVFFNNSACY
ncbi:hypothetical protein JXR93_02910 [bacterium]|nr:hypothetical protein [bacterium]